MGAALGWGALAASSLLIGAALGLERSWPDRAIGVVLAVAIICTLATVGGFAVADTASGDLKATIDGFAAGALLVMLIDSMISEAARKGGRIAGLVTVLGFAVAAALSGVA